MLTAGGGQTPNTNKGRAGVDAFNIPLIAGLDIKELLEIVYNLSAFIPHLSYYGCAPQRALASHPLPVVKAYVHR
jgi:hypothetical protein